jgi:hypothetical protein
MRTKQTIIEFKHGFVLSGLDALQPAGSYRVDVDEEEIEGLSFLAYRRTGGILYLPAGSHAGDCRSAVPLTLAELEAAVPSKA